MNELVVCSLEEWDDVWRRNQFLVDRLLHRRPELRILFVEPAADPTHDLRLKRLPRGPRVRTIEPRLRTFRPLKPLPRRVTNADSLLGRQVRVAARVLGFAHPTLWLNDVTYAPLIRQTGWPAVYDVTDDWLLAPASEREVERLRRLDAVALRDADQVVVCSADLARTRGADRAVTVIRNAVDVEHFRRPTKRPDDLPPAPVAVYVGTLHESRLDVNLIAELARANRQLSIALVGPDSLSQRSRAALAGEPNVVLLGGRSYDDVPAYLQHADVLVVPHLVNPFTESLDPIKAYECLAVAKPVVATPAAGFRELADALIVAGREEFVEAVQLAIAAPVPVARTADIPSWDDRAAEFEAVLTRAG